MKKTALLLIISCLLPVSLLLAQQPAKAMDETKPEQLSVALEKFKSEQASFQEKQFQIISLSNQLNKLVKDVSSEPADIMNLLQQLNDLTAKTNRERIQSILAVKEQIPADEYAKLFEAKDIALNKPMAAQQ